MSAVSVPGDGWSRVAVSDAFKVYRSSWSNGLLGGTEANAWYRTCSEQQCESLANAHCAYINGIMCCILHFSFILRMYLLKK